MKRLLLITFILISSSLFSQGWIQQTSNTANTLWSASFVDSLTGWAVGNNSSAGQIVKTTNGGVNWILLTSPVTNGLNACKFINANTGWIATEAGGVLKTTNGGSFWTTLTTGFGSPLYCMHFQDANTGWVAGQIGVVLKTTNGGTNWTAINAASSSVLFSGIHFTNSLTGYAVGGTLPSTGVAFKTTNGGSNWFTLNLVSSLVCEEVYFVNDNTGWITSNLGTILKTTNGGINWTSQNIATTHNIFDVIYINSLTGWVCGGSIAGSSSTGAIWKSTNGGTNWYSQYTGQLIANLNIVSNDIGYGVGYNGTILKTTTSGETVPLAPTLLSPANNSTNVGLTPTLFWNTVSLATSYKVIVSSMVTFGNIIDSATVTTNQRTIPGGKLNIASTYYWKVLASNQFGSSPWSDVWNFSTVITGISIISSEIPNRHNILQNFPNPFNPSTNIKFDNAKLGNVKIVVYDVMGREVQTLVNESLKPGTYEASFDGSALNSGVYFYKLMTDGFSETKKMLMIK